MNPYLIHKKLAKVAFVLCLLGAIIMTIDNYFFVDRDGRYGKYYLFTATQDGRAKRSTIFWRGRDCSLVLLYDSLRSTSGVSSYDFTMDTTSISIQSFELVELINFECDSLVGVIRFNKKFYNPNIRTSKAMIQCTTKD